MSTKELLDGVLKLSREERARLAMDVLSSLEESEDAVASAWASELDRRADEVESGSGETFAWEDVEKDVLSELAQRRANRTS